MPVMMACYRFATALSPDIACISVKGCLCALYNQLTRRRPYARVSESLFHLLQSSIKYAAKVESYAFAPDQAMTVHAENPHTLFNKNHKKPNHIIKYNTVSAVKKFSNNRNRFSTEWNGFSLYNNNPCTL